MIRSALYGLLPVLAALFASCEVVGGIFKAGMVWGIFLVAVFIGVIIYLVTRNKK
jgi:hypothetical protein